MVVERTGAEAVTGARRVKSPTAYKFCVLSVSAGRSRGRGVVFGVRFQEGGEVFGRTLSSRESLFLGDGEADRLRGCSDEEASDETGGDR